MAGSSATGMAWALVCLTAAMGGDAVAATRNETSTAPRAAIENEGADCTTTAAVAGLQASLPDPFARGDGSRLARLRADWRCQRQQTLRALEEQVYGGKGPAPDRVTGSVLRDRIEVTVTRGNRHGRASAPRCIFPMVPARSR
ncbi:hypothetical protein H1235_13745 [Pseudoxanthomonas sp. NC8]|nr:hypothetical protein H1235_13745 [Pseudoxanthomonas sp. NC8]